MFYKQRVYVKHCASPVILSLTTRDTVDCFDFDMIVSVNVEPYVVYM
jgi:hypothetical protein